MTDETPQVFLNRARLLLDLDRWIEAGEELVQARALAPRDVDVLTLSALVASHEGQSAVAVSFAEAATVVEPGHDEALITRAWVLASADDQPAMRAYAEDLVGEFPASGQSPTLVASALFSVVGGGQLALETAWRAVELAPTDPDAHWLLGRIAARMELEELAGNSFAEARRLEPFPGRRTGVWKLWWERYGGVDSAPAAPGPSGWGPILKVAAVVVVIGLVLAWLAAG